MQSYEEELTTICSDSLPFDVWPMVIAQTGARAYGNFTPLTKYEYIGIHLMNIDNVLSFPSNRTSPSVLERCFNAEEELCSIDGEVRCHFVSYEWWEFIRLMRDGLVPVALLDCIFLPTVLEVSVFQTLQPLLCQMVTSKNTEAITAKMKEALNNAYQRIHALVSARTFYYRFYQYKKLCEEGEYEWSCPMLLSSASELAQRVYTCSNNKIFEKEMLESFLEDASRLIDVTTELSLVTDLPKDIHPATIAAADDIVRTFRKTMLF
jgi:hypothetical protein